MKVRPLGPVLMTLSCRCLADDGPTVLQRRHASVYQVLPGGNTTFTMLQLQVWFSVISNTWCAHGAAFRKFICISRSISHASKSVVTCVITFLWGTSDPRKMAWVQAFPRVKQEWTEWTRHLSRNLCLCSVNCNLQTQNSSVLLKCLYFGSTPVLEGL